MAEEKKDQKKVEVKAVPEKEEIKAKAEEKVEAKVEEKKKEVEKVEVKKTEKKTKPVAKKKEVKKITNKMDDLNRYSNVRTDLPELKSGDVIRVSYRVIEGGKERIQVFEGTIIALKNSGVQKNCYCKKNILWDCRRKNIPIKFQACTED